MTGTTAGLLVVAPLACLTVGAYAALTHPRAIPVEHVPPAIVYLGANAQAAAIPPPPCPPVPVPAAPYAYPPRDFTINLETRKTMPAKSAVRLTFHLNADGTLELRSAR